ncbi:MAG: cytochrome C biogenesis protein [Peptococcaceae bacterium BICA1-8]|nr:MAG: cytochrome C biogenesis protein [Peptococcaceae bacterium BICA1-8]
MIADIGYLAILLSLMLSIYAIITSGIYLKKRNIKFFKSSNGAVYAMLLLSTLAVVSLSWLLFKGDFSVKYVYEYTSSDLSWFYRLTALWAGNDGSLLLWLWLLIIYTALVVKQNKIKDATPIAVIILLINSFFFLFVMAFLTNPFEKLVMAQLEGRGLNPMLQSPGMIIHPLATYLGYVGFAVPFAFSMAALFLNHSDDRWIKVTRGWTVIAWLFLTIGNLYGALWAYEELGWGGYWAWDPVENASFMPWLTGSAFLHSVMIQERKNMLKLWNIVLIIITYVLTLFGTYLVRSGILQSVHAFGSSALGKYFLAFTLAVLVASFALMLSRMNLLKGEREFESLISKETSFLLNNLILLGMAFATFWGTVFPLISEAFTDNKITVSIPFFNTVNAPLGIILVLLMGICPLIAWRKANIKSIIENFTVPGVLSIILGFILYVNGVGKLYILLGFVVTFFAFSATVWDVIKGVRIRKEITSESYTISFIRLLLRNRRRYGGYIIHLGILMMVFGIIGSQGFAVVKQATLKVGDSVEIGSYKINYDNLKQTRDGENAVVYAQLQVSKEDRNIGKMTPHKVFYPTQKQPSTEVAINSTWLEDLYIILAGWELDGTATFKILINPLVKWIWTGGYYIVVGTLFALWPGRGGRVGGKYVKYQANSFEGVSKNEE